MSINKDMDVILIGWLLKMVVDIEKSSAVESGFDSQCKSYPLINSVISSMLHRRFRESFSRISIIMVASSDDIEICIMLLRSSITDH